MLLLDTCALLWITHSQPIQSAASEAVRAALADSRVFISPISAWEIGVLTAKRRLTLKTSAADYIRDVLDSTGLRVAALTPQIAVASTSLPADLHSDPADRLLIATARAMDLELVTRDRHILDYSRAGHVRTLEC